MKNILLIILTIPIITFSQENITIKEAIKICLNQNFDIQISEREYEVSKINNNWSNAGALPTVDFIAKGEEAVSDQSQNPTSFIQEVLKSESVSTSINLNWILFNGYRIKASKEKLEILQELNNGNLNIIIENTIQAVILSYYNCLIQKERIDLIQEVVNLSKERLIYNETKYDIGLNRKIDVLQIENALLTDSLNLILQINNYQNSLRNFNLILGIDLEKKWNFTDEIEIKNQLFDIEILKEKILSDNNTLKNQYYNIELSKQDIKISKSVFFPTISLNSGASYNENTYDIGNSGYTGDNSGSTLNYYANFTLSYRLYDGGKYNRSIKTFEIQNDINNLILEKMKQEVFSQLTQNYQLYNNRIHISNISKKAFQIAKINYELANENYKLGNINSFNLRDLEINYLNSAISYLNSLFDLNESYLELVKMTGGFITEDF
tara:strand:+ start:8097 stop:9410 length:1314 start_codon:yes stop_codon:yes gene_type:complete